MAKRAREEYNRKEWQAFHGSPRQDGFLLDGMPEVAEMLKAMLKDCGSEKVVWAKVASYIRDKFPFAPKGWDTYKRFALERLDYGK